MTENEVTVLKIAQAILNNSIGFEIGLMMVLDIISQDFEEFCSRNNLKLETENQTNIKRIPCG